MKPFFDVFPTLKVRNDLRDYFEETDVEKLTTNHEHTRLKVRLHSGHLIHKNRVYRMQDEISSQLFRGDVEVYIDEHYSLSAQYTPRRLLEEYSDSIGSEIESFSHVMGNYFRGARFEYDSERDIRVIMEDSCLSRGLSDRLEDALNRIFRERCGVPATLTVELEKRPDAGKKCHAQEPAAALTGAAAAFAVPGSVLEAVPEAGLSGDSAGSGTASDPRRTEGHTGAYDEKGRRLDFSRKAGARPDQNTSGNAGAAAGAHAAGSGAFEAAGASGRGDRAAADAPAGSDQFHGRGRDRSGEKSRYGEKGRYGSKRPYSLSRSNNPDVIFGREITQEAIPIADVVGEIGEVVVRGQIMGNDRRDIRNNKTIVRFSITDFTDSVYCKIFVPTDFADELLGCVSKGTWVKIRGAATFDSFDKEIILSSLQGVQKIPAFKEKRKDLAQTGHKRVELHCHTKMSDMDGVSECRDLVKRAYEWGMPAIAITDHGNVQAFPDANHLREELFSAENRRRRDQGLPPVDTQDFFKVIYGVECYLVDDLRRSVVFGENETAGDSLEGHTYVVFDLETTGFSPEKNRIIEFGAVKVRDGRIIGRFSEFVNPEIPIPYRITQLTSITDDMVSGADTISGVLPRFLEFSDGCVLVGHNVAFDIGFVRANCRRLGLACPFTTVDTLGISRALLPGHSKYTLDAVAKILGVSLENHHRAVDDAECTAGIFLKEMPMLENLGCRTYGEVNALSDSNPDIVKRLRTHHCVLLARNNTGRVNLYKMISASHLQYFHKKPRIPKSLLMKHREGILVGSACVSGELFEALLEERGDEALAGIAGFYDYLEIQPRANNRFLLESPRMRDRYPQIRTEEDLLDLNRRIVKLGEQLGKPVVATGDAHFLDPEDEIYRTIIQDGMGMSEEEPAPLYLHTTDEMLAEFSYLGAAKAEEVVVTNTQKIADMIEVISPVRPDKCPPVIPHSDEMLREICYRKAHSMYGDPLPEIVSERLERELNSIIRNGYSVMYIIAQKLVWKSVEDGYLVGSRGSVGSSFVATMAGITEVNPLPPHYYCPQCRYSEFDSEVIRQHQGQTGIDLPDKMCPRCGHKLVKAGFDIPFETFLGFKGDKEPDIDLNFSGEYQAKAHAYTKVIFGDRQTFKAGTIATVADKTAYGYVKNYFERKGVAKRRCEIERLLQGCTGIRRSTGQHPGGIVVLPIGEDINTFTPVQHPANDMTTDIVTTHFDYHSIDHNLLKLDILGHDDPTMVRMLQDLTGIDPMDIPLDDRDVMELFSSTKSLGVTPQQLGGIKVGTLGVPEFGTKFVMGMLESTHPGTMSELLKISGLSHGTDVWLGNAEELIKDGKCTLSTCIGCRDDIMTYLISMGLDPSESFTIMERVRKGKVAKGGVKEWPQWCEDMREHGVPDWYMRSCEKIKYMFPKGHAVAYVMMALRIAYFKVHEPLAYYSAYFSIRAKAFSYEIMCRGQAHLLAEMEDYQRRKSENSLTPKEEATLEDMKLVREMYARGYEFMPIDIYRAGSRACRIIDGKIMPPLKSIDGMGENAADAVVEAVKDGPFLSREDFYNRTKVPRTVVEKMNELGLFGDLPESNQISMFDLI